MKTQQQNSEKIKEISKYRLWLNKKGDAKYLSHHDVILLLQQAIRKADLPVTLYGDYNPRMKMSFHTSVAVGVSCEGEPVDIVFFEDIGSELLVEKLKKKLPSGMEIVKAEKILPTKLKYFLKIFYYIEVSQFIAPEKSLELMSSSNLFINRYKENTTKKIDIRPYLLECKIENPNLECSAIYVVTTMGTQGSVSVWEILELLGIPKESKPSIAITRTLVELVPHIEIKPS